MGVQGGDNDILHYYYAKINLFQSIYISIEIKTVETCPTCPVLSCHGPVRTPYGGIWISVVRPSGANIRPFVSNFNKVNVSVTDTLDQDCSFYF